ncbi:MAG TPA: endopeptidase La [Anaerolineaceae bacterium]|nr:endopeptidase La [Anaerolineaceae bacterium]
MNDEDFFPFPLNLENQFKLSKFANFEELNAVKNHKLSKDGSFTAPVLSLQNVVLFPNTITPLSFNPKSLGIKLVTGAQEQKTTLIGCYEDPSAEAGHPLTRCLPVGIEFVPSRINNEDPEAPMALLQGRRRVRILELSEVDGLTYARVTPIKEVRSTAKETKALMRLCLKQFGRYLELEDNSQDEILNFAEEAQTPGELADFIGSALDLEQEDRLKLLMEADGISRLHLIARLLTAEINLLELEEHIQTQVQSEMDRSQRENYLREQISKMQKEIGDGKSADPEILELQEKLEAAGLSTEARAAADKELARLRSMPSLSPESGMLENYLQWLADLPWNAKTEDNLDINNASAVLDSNHYGLKKAKDRILEFLAVRSLKPTRSHQPILCFVGAPGTGKTSLGRSIATAMGRRFARMSLGGVHDEAEIRGHRRTYIGSMPGRILQTMKKVGVVNPLIMLDEIDKLNADFQGDPASALLEVLDSEQNFEFADHYLEVPYDLSKTLFVTTANSTQNIPPALLDRMELIEFPGYAAQEKMSIARQFLINSQMAENGLEGETIEFTDDALQTIIEGYTYEAGVRSFERQIGTVLRKLALQKTKGQALPAKIDKADLPTYLGPIEYFPLVAELKDEIGVATAVAWTESGGEIMPVEVLVMPGKGNLQITGQIGEVMQESAQAALSYLKSKSEAFQIPVAFFEEYDFHIHVPEGAIPKDGPSAGITMALALTSAVLGLPVRRELAMTGEITLRGKVLPIGGVREKVLAAQRSGIKTMLLPAKNEKDLEELQANVREALEFHFVEQMDEVLDYGLVSKPIFSRVMPKQRKRKKTENED